jgi:hypothetical protein
MKKRVYKVTLNGETFLHSLTKKEGEKFLESLHGWESRSHHKGIKEVKTPLGLFQLTQDRWVLVYRDTVVDSEGESYHILIKELDGTKLSSVYGGDYTCGIPNANSATPVMESAASNNF